MSGEAHLVKKGPAKGQEPSTLVDRRLSKQTLEKYGVTLGYNGKGDATEHFYPYMLKGEHVATKIRIVEGKDFRCSGTMNEAELFGQHLVPQGGKYITITEGELDAMSILEMTGFPGVSVKSSSSAVKDVKQNFDFLNSFNTIVLAFDRDEPKVKTDGTVHYPGQEAAEKVARLFKSGKVRIVDMHPYKDPNDFLKAGKTKEFNDKWWRAKPFQMDGIVAGNTLWEMVSKEQTYTSIPYPFKGMNEKLYGFRTSEMVTVTAGTGVGKTTLLKHLAVWIKNHAHEKANVGMLMLEETLRETGLGLMSAAAGVPLHLPDVSCSLADKKKAFDDTLGSGRFYMHDHFGSTSIDNIMDKVDKLASQYDCKYIILDHISIVVSDQQNGDERRALDEIATKLKTFCTNRDVCLFIVCHLKRINGKPAEEGGQISLSDLRGTAGIGQLSNIVIGLERNIQAENDTESNRVRVRILKNRFSGKAGVACELEFDYDTFSYTEVPPVTDKPTSEVANVPFTSTIQQGAASVKQSSQQQEPLSRQV